MIGVTPDARKTKMTFDSAARLASLRDKMRDTDTDLVALGPGSYMQWALGFHTHADERPCLLLIGPQRETFLMPALNAEASRAETATSFHTWGRCGRTGGCVAGGPGRGWRQHCAHRLCRRNHARRLRFPAARRPSGRQSAAMPARQSGRCACCKDASEYDAAENERRHRR